MRAREVAFYDEPSQVDEAMLFIDEAVADEHLRQEHALLDWKHCSEPLCEGMRRALEAAREILDKLEEEEWE